MPDKVKINLVLDDDAIEAIAVATKLSAKTGIPVSHMDENTARMEGVLLAVLDGKEEATIGGITFTLVKQVVKRVLVAAFPADDVRHGDLEKPYFQGVGTTKEEAWEVMANEALAFLNEVSPPEPGEPPISLEHAKGFIEDQHCVAGPFEIEVKL